MRDEVEVCVRIGGEDHLVGSLHRQPRREFEAVGFHYAPAWLDNLGDERADYMAELTNQADTLLLGRRSYQGFVTFWPDAPNNPKATEAEKTIGANFNAMRKVVFSTSLTRADWHETTIMRSIEPEQIGALKAESARGVRLDGSISIVQQLTSLGVIDEYRLMVHPVALGRGRPLFTERVDLELVGSEQWKNGVVVHTYRLASGAEPVLKTAA